MLEDSLMPKTSVFVRAVSRQLDEEYGKLTHRVFVCPPTPRTSSRPLADVVQVATIAAKKAAVDAETMAIYVLPTVFGYRYGDIEGASDLMISVIALQDGPVGVFMDFPDGPNVPNEVFEYVAREADGMKKTVLRRKIPASVDKRTRKFMESVRAGLRQWPQFYN